jgi:hypothetical protein
MIPQLQFQFLTIQRLRLAHFNRSLDSRDYRDLYLNSGNYSDRLIPKSLVTIIERTAKLLTALCAQTRTKRFFESVAKQHFQKIFCGSFDR